MRESKSAVLASGFPARKNWSCTNNDLKRPKPRASDFLATALCLLAFGALPPASRAQVPVYEVTPVESTIRFGIESSVSIKGTFDKWDASIKFSSVDVTSAVLDVEIDADSVNTGGVMKNGKLRSKDFFDVKEFPMITFKSKKVVQTGSNTFDLECDFTIRGVTKKEKLTLTASDRVAAASIRRL